MKKKWSILLTANLLSALVSPLVVHAVKPTTQSETIMKNMFQSSQTHETETLTQSDLTKQLLDNSESDTTTENTEKRTLDTTSDTSNNSLLEESTQEQDNISENKIKSQAKSKKMVSDNKVDNRAANFAATQKVAPITGKWKDVSWKFDSNTGTLTFTSGGKLGEASESPWNTKKVNNLKIKKIVFTQEVTAPQDSSRLFSGDNLTSEGDRSLVSCEFIEGIEHVKVDNVTNMFEMFAEMHALKKLDLHSWKPQNVKEVGLMFKSTFIDGDEDEQIISLDISSFQINARKMKGVESMFQHAKFNQITVGRVFKLYEDRSFNPDFVKSRTWYNEEGENVGSSSLNNKTFLNYLAEGHPGTYTTYHPDNPPEPSEPSEPSEEVLKWGTVPYKFDESTGVLTFMDGGTFSGSMNSPWNRRDSNRINGGLIKKIVFTKKVKAPKDSAHLFCNVKYKVNENEMFESDLLSNLESFEHLDYLDTSDVTNMDSFFSGLHTIKTLDLSKFDTRSATNMNGMFYKAENITSLNLDYPLFDTSKVTIMSEMFQGMSSLTKLNMPKLNTSSVTNFTGMFKDVSSMTNLNLSQFNTSAATSMLQMFNGMKNLKTINVSSFDTSKVINMGSMFSGASSLTKLDVRHFNTSNVTKMDSMFNRTSSLTQLDVKNFKTDKVTNMSSMFNGNSGLTELDVKNFDTHNVTKMDSMFNGNSGLTELDVKNFDTHNVTKMDSMFNGTSSLTELDVSHFNTSNTENMQSMFADMTNLTSLNLGSFDFTKVTKVTTVVNNNVKQVSAKLEMFKNANSLKKITLPKTFSDPKNDTKLPDVPINDIYNGNWVNIDDKSKKLGQTKNFLKATANKAGTYVWGEKAEDMLRWGTVPYKFDESTGVLTFVKGGTFENSKEYPGGYANSPWNRTDGNKIEATKIKEIVFTESVNTPANSKLLFSSTGSKLTALTKISGIEKIDTSRATTMDQMFSGMSSLKELDLSNFSTNNVTNMFKMFDGMSSLEKLNVSSFDTKKVDTMTGMFRGLSKLETLDISNFDTQTVRNMTEMFKDDQNMKTLIFNKNLFNTSNVTNMSKMFINMKSLNSIDVSNFDTSKVTKMTSMFEGMDKLSSLNLGSFDFTKVTDKSNMFGNELKQDPIKEITLPKTFSDPTNETNLTKVSTTDGYNGQWQNNEGKLFGQTRDFLANYNGEKDAGTYRWGEYLKWGDVPYEFNEETGVLTFYKNGPNVLGEYLKSPWSREDKYKIKATDIKKIVFTEPTATPINSTYLFSGLTNVTTFKGLDKLDTSKTNQMHGMFYQMNSLETLDVSSFNTTNVTDMSSMFQEVSNLKTLDISNFDTSNVETMHSMFVTMSNLTNLKMDSKKFNTEKVEHMNMMFANETNLKELDVSHFNTSNVTDMYGMFADSTALTNLDVSSFDTSKVTNMQQMFQGMTGVSSLNLGNFNTSKVTKMTSMFEGMDKLSSLNLGSFDFTKVTDKSKMFGNESKQDPIKEITLPTTFSDPKNETNLTKVSITDGYNGQWQNNEGKLFGQTDKFLQNYNGEKDAGTYVWGRQAELRLVSVPTLYDFGSNNAIRDKAQMLKPKDKSSKNVEVQDDRKSKTSWSLSVKASPLVSEHQESLQQVRYQFGISTSKSSGMPINIMTYLDRQVELPTNNESQALYTITDKSNANETYDTSINNMTLILDQNTGKPKEQYSGTITWSLDMTPQD